MLDSAKFPDWAGAEGPMTWAGPPHPKMLLIGEAWGESEAMTRLPFVGAAGQELWRMLGEAIGESPDLHARAGGQFLYGPAWGRSPPRNEWLASVKISMTNVFNIQPIGNKIENLCEDKKSNPGANPRHQLIRGQYLRGEHLPELVRLRLEIEQSQPNLIVPLGNTASWAVLSSSAIGSIRGNTSLTPGGALGSPAGIKALPTYHPAGVLRQWSWRPIVVADLMKAWNQAQFPELIRPSRQVLINPTISEIGEWVRETLGTKAPNYLACDIETKGGQITCIGFARSSNEALVIPFVNLGVPGGSQWSLAEE